MSTQAFTTTPRRLLRLPEVLSIIGMKRSWWFNEIREGRGVRPLKIGRASVWDSVEVDNFVTKLVSQQATLPQADDQPEAGPASRVSGRRAKRRGTLQ